MRWLGAVVAILLAGVLVACGVTTQDRPEELTTPAPESEPTTSSPTTGPARATIYLVRDARLIAVPRSVGSPQDLDEVVGSLLRGPQPVEASSGMRSAVPAGTRALSVTVSGRVAELALPPEFAQLDGDQQILALAQVVFTLTESGRVGGVRLTDGERALPAPTDSGRLVSRPVGRSDYDELAPPADTS